MRSMPRWTVALLSAGGTYLALSLARQFASRETRIKHEIDHTYDVEDERFLYVLGKLLPPAMLEGNRVTPLINGDQIFPAMLDAIHRAEKTITFETFIYWSGGVAREFTDAMSERARAGVRVHVILDWFGSKPMEQTLLEQMTSSGVQVERYHPPQWHSLSETNFRTHRKILVVDGRIGFTGGVGIADEWTGNAEDPDHWRDTHFKLEGPCVGQLQTAFMDNWLKTHDTVLYDAGYFPLLEPAGTATAQVFASSPAEGAKSMRLMYLFAITAATRSILVSTAYFVPDPMTVDALISARRRGVRVEIIVPGPHIDKRIVRIAARGLWGRLLKAGVKIYEYQPTMYHCKVMIIDGQFVSVGSTNMDNRSFRLNDEVNVNLMDEQLAADLTEWFERDRDASRQIRLEQWRNRPLAQRIREDAVDLVRSQL